MGCGSSAELKGQRSSGPKAFDELPVVEYEWRKWGFITRGHWRSKVSEDRKQLSTWLPDNAFGDNGRARFTALIGPLCKQIPTDGDPLHVILKVHSTMRTNRTYLGVGSTDSQQATVPGGLNGIGFAVHGQGGFDHEGGCIVKWKKERKPTFGSYGEWTDYIGVGVNPKEGTVVLATKMGPGKKTTKVYDVNWGSITLPPNWFFAIGAFLDNSQRGGYDKPAEGLTCEVLSAGPGDLLETAAKLFQTELVDPRTATSSSKPGRTTDDIPAKKIEIKLENVPLASDDCVFCRQPLKDRSTTVGTCGHSYHSECVEQWVNVHAICVLCKQPWEAVDMGPPAGKDGPPAYEDAPPPPAYHDAPPSYQS